jgi:RND family efflux transporter MFP subunit
VAPKVSGRVLRVHVRQGDQVEKGDLLVELDPADEVAALRLGERQRATAVADAKRAAADVAVMRANLAEAVGRATRARALSAAGVMANAEAEDMDARALALARTVDASQAESGASIARMNEAAALVAVRRTGLENLSLRAPFDGLIINKPPQVGEYIGPQPAGIAADMGGLRIANLTSLIVEADIPEERYHLLRVGMSCEVVLDAFAEARFRGRLETITPQVDRAKATFRVHVALVDRAAGVVPDLGARVTFFPETTDREQASATRRLVVASAVLQRSGKAVIFPLSSGQVSSQYVVVGKNFGSEIELLEGPAAGTVVVLNPTEDMAVQ